MTKLNAAIYARQSKHINDDERLRDEESVSIPQQVTDGKALAVEKGLVLADKHIYIDAGLGGNLPPTCWAGEKARARPGLSDLLTAIERGEVQVVIVRKLDRLARKLTLSLRLYEFFSDHKVGLLCTSENLPSGQDASGRFVLSIVSTAAAYVRETISENIRDAKRQAKREGRKMCRASQTTGYLDGERGKVLVDPATAPAATGIFERYAAGKPIAEILRWLREEYPNARKHNARSAGGEGGKWYGSTIMRMVRNPHYIGCAYNGEGEMISSKAYPALVSKDLFAKCQERLVVQKGMRPRAQREPHLLSGFLCCGYCGKPLALQQKRCKKTNRVLGYYYRCAYGYHGRGSGRAPCHVLEPHWIDWAESFWSTHHKVETKSEQASAIIIQLGRIDENLARLKRTIARGAQDDDGLVDEFADIARQAVAEKSKLQAQLNALPRSSSSIKPWSEMNAMERRSELRYMLKSVSVYRDSCVVNFQKHTGRKSAMFPLMKRAPAGPRYNNNDLNCWVPRKMNANEAALVMTTTNEAGAQCVNWEHYVSDDFYYVCPDHALNGPSISSGILRSQGDGKRCNIRPKRDSIQVIPLPSRHRPARSKGRQLACDVHQSLMQYDKTK